MLFLTAAALTLDACAILLATTLARAGRLPRLASRIAWLAAHASSATALYSVHILREGFRDSESAAASEKTLVLARQTGHALDFALAALILAVLLLLALAARVLLSRQPGGEAT